MPWGYVCLVLWQDPTSQGSLLNHSIGILYVLCHHNMCMIWVVRMSHDFYCQFQNFGIFDPGFYCQYLNFGTFVPGLWKADSPNFFLGLWKADSPKLALGLWKAERRYLPPFCGWDNVVWLGFDGISGLQIQRS